MNYLVGLNQMFFFFKRIMLKNRPTSRFFPFSNRRYRYLRIKVGFVVRKFVPAQEQELK